MDDFMNNLEKQPALEERCALLIEDDIFAKRYKVIVFVSWAIP